MQFALVNYARTLPSTGLTGSCPVCDRPMIAKCGNVRIHHWAHLGVRTCDPWWEPETEWHRVWKNRFPCLWREQVHSDGLGEKHVADVLTPHGLTIEFQHSHLKPEVRDAREAFYKKMAWVVDGTRLKGDVPRFLEGIRTFRDVARDEVFITPTPNEAFPRAWLNCKAPVLFDFDGAVFTGPNKFVGQSLWCLLPDRVLGYAVVMKVSHETFVRWAHEREKPIPDQALMEHVATVLRTEHQEQRQLDKLRVARPGLPGWLRHQNNRRRLPKF